MSCASFFLAAHMVVRRARAPRRRAAAQKRRALPRRPVWAGSCRQSRPQRTKKSGAPRASAWSSCVPRQGIRSRRWITGIRLPLTWSDVPADFARLVEAGSSRRAGSPRRPWRARRRAGRIETPDGSRAPSSASSGSDARRLQWFRRPRPEMRRAQPAGGLRLAPRVPRLAHAAQRPAASSAASPRRSRQLPPAHRRRSPRSPVGQAQHHRWLARRSRRSRDREFEYRAHYETRAPVHGVVERATTWRGLTTLAIWLPRGGRAPGPPRGYRGSST